MLDAIVWYATLQLVALAVYPLVARAARPLDDRGWAISKVVGWLLLAYVTWIVTTLTSAPFTRSTLVAVAALLALIAWGGLARRDGRLAWAFARFRLIAAWELLFIGVFVLFCVLRAADPSISGTEKPMDMAFLSGFAAADRMPTQDAWLAGFGVPHYYFGWFAFASLTKLSGVPPGVAYNLAAATVPALAALALGALAWNVARAARLRVARARVATALSVFLIMIAGNLSAPLELGVAAGILDPSIGATLGINRFAATVHLGAWPPDGAWWWRASRVIPNIQPDGISEFPFFSSYLGDLHPHFMALPIEGLALTVAAALIIGRPAAIGSIWTQGLAALVLGALLATNTWDVPAFWIVFVAAAFWAGAAWPVHVRVLLALAAPISATALFAPFLLAYHGAPLGIDIVSQRTPLGSLLVLFGPQLAILIGLGLWQRRRTAYRTGWLLVFCAANLGVVLAIVGEGTLGFLLVVMALVLPWPGLHRMELPLVIVMGAATMAVALLLSAELVFVSDAFGTRMNTVFKLQYNAWLLAGLAAGLGVAFMVDGRSRWSLRSWLAAGLVGLVVAVGAVYPISAIQTRLTTTPPGGLSLDGMSFMDPDEAEMVRWLQSARYGRPVIAEAVAPDYSSGGRMATFSGGSAVLGWVDHELQWRGDLPEFEQRRADLKALYVSADQAGQRAIVDRYAVDFIVVGNLEREIYGPGIDRRFDAVWPVAFRTGSVAVYRTH